MSFSKYSNAKRLGFKRYTMDFAIALEGVLVLLENKNLVFLGTSTGNGYDPFPLDTGTSNMFKYLVNNDGRKSSQFTDPEFFIQRAMMEAHWISQKIQFVTESHMSTHCAIQSIVK
uniref:Binding n=1 Tax=Arundo donax TaxID=35708 RepID=A0A0A9DEV7_ARUDO